MAGTVVIITTPKGAVRHLAAEYSTHTLCGRWHGVNHRYVYATFDSCRYPAWDGTPEGVCARCVALAANAEGPALP